jgi:hypothetical protein
VVKFPREFYESLPTDKEIMNKLLPEGWKIVYEEAHLDSPDVKFVHTRIEFVDPETNQVAIGLFQVTYSPESKKLVLRAAYRRRANTPGAPKIPEFTDIGVSFPGREGIPTWALFMSYQMRQVGIPYGGVESVVWDSVINVETRLHVKWLTSQRQYRDVPLKHLIAHTPIVRGAETGLMLSGHEIVPGSFEVEMEPEVPIGHERWTHRLPDSEQLDPDYEQLELYYELRDKPDETTIPRWFPRIEAAVRPVN